MTYGRHLQSISVDRDSDPEIMMQINALMALRTGTGRRSQGRQIVREILRESLPRMIAEEQEVVKESCPS